jgi:DNA invertase Pin-like site-specific DNA recombinase
MAYSVGMTTPHARLRLVPYGRVSTSGQLDGYGPDVQLSDMQKWARREKHTLLSPLFDGAVSGTVDGEERPALSEAMAMVAAGEADGILAPNMDRLARELTVQEGALAVVWAHGGRVFTVDQGEVLPDDQDDPTRTLIRQVIGAVGQFERGMIAKRLRSGREKKGAAGGYAGGAPAYGQRAEGGDLVEHDGEAEVLRAIEAMRAEGLSLRTIADRLNADQVPTKRGGRWSASTVSRVLDPGVRAAHNAREAAARGRRRDDAKARKAARLVGRIAG